MACTSDRHQLTGELLITPPPIAQRSIVMSVSVCLSVCLSVCVWVCVCSSVRDHIFGPTRPIFTNSFRACYLWPRLGPPLAV